MTDNKNDSNNYKSLIQKTNEINSVFENISNSALMNSTNALAKSMKKFSSSVSSDSFRGISEASLASLSNSILINSLSIDSSVKESLDAVGKAMRDASNSIAYSNIRMTQEALTNLTNSIFIDTFSIDPSLSESIQSISNAIQKMTVSIPNFSEMVSEIDWDTIDFTDSDVEKAEEIINSENIGDAISEEINKDITAPQLPNSIMSIIFLFLFIMNSFSLLDFSLVNIENLDISIEINTNEKIPSVKSNFNSEKSSKKIPKKHIVNRIQKNIKPKIPKIFLGTLGIITKSIYVYEKKRLDSKRIGKLNSFVTVKIIKQNRNWTYVLFQDSDRNVILEGWTLTRYIQKIK